MSLETGEDVDHGGRLHMNKASNFAVGDLVRILPTAPAGLPSMQKDRGRTGTVVGIYDGGSIRVMVPSTGGSWLWGTKDLVFAVSKWRRGECR